ncbi:MAG: hypothetical protein AB8G22_02285 [Saprospiraceae bacterium]
MTARLILFLFSLFSLNLYSQTLTPFEKDAQRNSTPTYQEVISFYEQLAEQHPQQFKFTPHGATDSGFPLHLGVLSSDGNFSPTADKLTIFVNNAIHPGEPCGVDATMLLVRDYLEKKVFDLGENITLVFVPFYNIGGGLNRGGYSRANQEGPHAHGFRGNAKNLDLNRDFIKCDSRNAQTFNQLYAKWQPDIFVDNHTSNGADYQYTLTLIPTQHNKLSEPLSGYLQNRMLPYLFNEMAQRKWEMTPYVYARETPDEGIYGFLDLPRYSSGYAALHHALSFMPETHMLKPFGDRVQSVYEFMQTVIQLAKKEHETIRKIRADAIKMDRTADSLAINWTLDPTLADTIQFKGYTAKYKPSAVSGLDRLYYDRNEPFTKSIPHFNYYKTTAKVAVPRAYIIPQAWEKVIERLRWNGVEMQQLADSISLSVEQQYIEDYESRKSPYEGHYLHSNVTTRSVTNTVKFRAGDYVVFTDQSSIRYLVETLEPTAPDSYFAWNFFDAILQQKEYFSSYVFEDTAAEMLVENPDLAAALAAAKQQDSTLLNSARQQLDFIYKRSPYYEQTHQLYPVARWNGERVLPMNK